MQWVTMECNVCGEGLSDDSFYYHSTGGRYTQPCKDCTKKARRQYYSENKELVQDRVRRYRERNPDKVAETNFKYDEANRERRRQYAARYRKTEKGRQIDRVRGRNRRAKKRETYDGYLDSEIFDRDGWVCWICSEDIDPSLSHPEPMSGSIDHVLPLSLGGADNRQNVKASHLICNVKRPRAKRHYEEILLVTSEEA